MFSFDEEDISSPHSLKVTRRLIKKSKSPGGTERVVGTKDFNFKKLPEGPSQRERDFCRRLQSQARERAKIQLSPERNKAANAKRLKGPGGAAVAAAEGAVHAGDAPDSSSLGIMALGTANPDFANLPGERNRQRDWAILRGFKASVEFECQPLPDRNASTFGQPLPDRNASAFSQHLPDRSANTFS